MRSAIHRHANPFSARQQRLIAGIGDRSASRAVGLANGSNPLPIVIPCHRVIGSNGKLTGYGGGLPIKARLLALEGALPARPLFHRF